MPELFLQPPEPPEDPTQKKLDVDRLQTSEVLSSIETKGILIDNREQVLQSLENLREKFAIQDEAFDDFKRTLIITSVANRMVNLAEEDGKVSQEMGFMADIIMNTAGQYTQFSTEHTDTQEDKVSEEHAKKVYDKYTQPELTDEMTEFIHGPAFDTLRQRLGITEEEPYEVRVLSIDAGNGLGLIPNINFEEGMPYDKYKELANEQEYRRDYATKLRDRTTQFAEELGREDVFAPAWVTFFKDGSKYLCLAAPLAEKIMYTDEQRADYYSEDDRKRDFAIIEHEYVHTQKILTNGEVGLGIALEELRAEHFSGNKQGYVEIKRFFSSIQMLTGYDVRNSFEIEGKPYDQDEFLTDIAKNIGLEGLLDAVTAIPRNYAEDEESDNFVKELVKFNGGLSGQFESIYKRLVQQEGLSKIDERISAYVDSIYNQLGNDSAISTESWFAYGGVDSFRDAAIENFRRRYPDRSDGYNYSN